MANLDAEYAVLPGSPILPAMDEIPTMDPRERMMDGKA
jgi:hypothetical protein